MFDYSCIRGTGPHKMLRQKRRSGYHTAMGGTHIPPDIVFAKLPISKWTVSRPQLQEGRMLLHEDRDTRHFGTFQWRTIRSRWGTCSWPWWGTSRESRTPRCKRTSKELADTNYPGSEYWFLRSQVATVIWVNTRSSHKTGGRCQKHRGRKRPLLGGSKVATWERTLACSSTFVPPWRSALRNPGLQHQLSLQTICLCFLC